MQKIHLCLLDLDSVIGVPRWRERKKLDGICKMHVFITFTNQNKFICECPVIYVSLYRWSFYISYTFFILRTVRANMLEMFLCFMKINLIFSYLTLLFKLLVTRHNARDTLSIKYFIECTLFLHSSKDHFNWRAPCNIVLCL